MDVPGQLRPGPPRPAGWDGVAAAVAAFGVLEAFALGDYRSRWAWALSACACGAALLLGRRRPLVALAAVLAIVVVSDALIAGTDNPLFPFVAVLVACFAAGAYGGGRSLWPAVGFAVAVYAAVTLARRQPVGDAVFIALMVAGAGALGLVLAERRERARLLVREAEREARAREAVAKERARIARELHDVVAHSMSVVVLQVGAVRRLLAPGQERERDVLFGVEATGREALAEMRRLLGIQRRAEDGPTSLAPQPGLARLDELLDGVREAGLPVELAVEGTAVPLPPGLDLSAYRIVQEALTNTLKHAGRAQATVFVRYGARTVELEVLDDGQAPPAQSDGRGQGLIGMRERVALYGGALAVGPRPGGGFRVHARLPVRSDA